MPSMPKHSFSYHTLPTELIHLSTQRTLIIRRSAKIAIIVEIALSFHSFSQLVTVKMVITIEISLDRLSQTQMPEDV